MTAPIVIQHPGSAQFAQQGLQQGAELGQRQQALTLQRQQQQAEVAARQRALDLEERQVEANEAFRRGYGNYLTARGQYYGAKADEVHAQQQRTEQFLAGITDPEQKQTALLALSDPRLSAAITAQQGQQGHLKVLAGNLWLHGQIPYGRALQAAGLQPTGDPKVDNMMAPATQQYDTKTRMRISALSSENARIGQLLKMANDETTQYRTFLGNQALTDPKLRNAGAQQIDSIAQAYIAKKYPNLDSLRTKYINNQAELMGTVAPHLGPQAGLPGAPVIPDPFGGGAQPGTGQIDLQGLSDQIDRLSEVFDNLQVGGAGGTSQPQQPQ